MQFGVVRVFGMAALVLALSAGSASAGRGGKVNCDVNPGNVDCVGNKTGDSTSSGNSGGGKSAPTDKSTTPQK